MKYHIGIAGAGFSGAVLARELAESDRFKITVFEERSHVGGNCHTSRDEETGIMVHHHGAHVFHTDREDIWNYVNQWGRFEPYLHRVKAETNKGIFSLPINLLTINQFFQKKMGPKEARDFVGSLGQSSITSPKSFEDQAFKFIGKEIYEHFFKGFTQKLWGTDPSKLPASTLMRSPVRFNYNDDYYDQKYQGIPVSGYTEIIKRILDHHNIELRVGQKLEPERKRDFDHIFWSGPMDGFFKCQLGKLPYRSLKFERFVDNGDYQGIAVINYCQEDVPFTRVTEHKHLTPWEEHEKTICFKEYAKDCEEGDIPHYPLRLNTHENLFGDYINLAKTEERITFMGRLGTYRNLEMQTVISESLDLAAICLSKEIKDWPRFSSLALR